MPDPRSVLLTKDEVAARLGLSPKTVDKARNATDPRSFPRPLPGWVNVGSATKPRYMLPEQALIDYIAEGLERA